MQPSTPPRLRLVSLCCDVGAIVDLASIYEDLVIGVQGAYETYDFKLSKTLFLALEMYASIISSRILFRCNVPQLVTLVIKALSWCCMLVMIGLETMVYVYEVRWFVRSGLVYVMLGDAVLFNLVLSVSKFYSRDVLYLYSSEVAIQVSSSLGWIHSCFWVRKDLLQRRIYGNCTLGIRQKH